MNRWVLIKSAWRRFPALTTFSIGASLSGIFMLLVPNSVVGSSVVFESWNEAVGTWVWPAFFASGGLFLLRGLALHRPGSEAAGLVLIASALLIYAIALITFLEGDFGGSWTDSFVVLTVFIGSSVALLNRAYVLVRGIR